MKMFLRDYEMTIANIHNFSMALLTLMSSNDFTTYEDNPSTYGPSSGCSRTFNWEHKRINNFNT